MISKEKRLGEILIDRKVLTADQVQIALLEQQKTGKPFGETLISLGFLTEELLTDILAETLGQQAIDLEQILADPQALALIPKELARRCAAFPVSFDSEQRELIIAIADPNDILATDRIRNHLGKDVIPVWRIAPRAAT